MTFLSIQFSLQYSFSILTTCSSAFVHTSFVILPKAAYVSYLTSFNRKVVLFLATKPFTCAHIKPALKNPSLVVLDNASYHNVKTEDMICPNFNQKQAVLQNYLTQHNIPFSVSLPEGIFGASDPSFGSHI
jgi:hypothetical protein